MNSNTYRILSQAVLVPVELITFHIYGGSDRSSFLGDGACDRLHRHLLGHRHMPFSVYQRNLA
jgi:hypothetical protein